MLRPRKSRAWALLLLAAGLATPARAEHLSKKAAAEVRYSPWQSNRATPFVSLASDVGFIYARPRLTVGYGAPFWSFVGVDVSAISTNSFAQPSIGWRASLPFLDAILFAREVYPYNRRFMAPRTSHDSFEMKLAGGRRSVYRSVDLEVALIAPLFHGGVLLQAHPLFVDAPRDVHMYEEYIRAIMVPPFALGTRAGYVYGFGDSGSVKAGAMVEYVVLPGRTRNVTRFGPVALATFSKHLDGFAAFSFVVSSPDDLDITDGTYAFIGILHRWAQRF